MVTVLPFGFVDVGWFLATGDGTSYRDVEVRPTDAPCPRGRAGLGEQAWIDEWSGCDIGWVYTGDPWASTVNTQGEAADLGGDITNFDYPDRMDSDGRSTFVVNAVELGLVVAREEGPDVGARAAVWVEPDNDLENLGSWVSLDQGHVYWKPGRGTVVRVGQLESPFGREWELRRASRRRNVTPSMMARYTSGTPLGASVTSRVGDWDVAAALTNGGTATRHFGLFWDPGTDDNGAPTFTSRVGRVLPPGPVYGRVGVSGQVGATDGLKRVVPSYAIGGDLELAFGIVHVQAEYLLVDANQGGQADPSDPVAWADEPRLLAHGGYLAGTLLTGAFQEFARVDRRTGTIALPAPEIDHAYLSDVLRFTMGASWTPPGTDGLTVKLEALRILELLGEPIPNDVVTSSVVYAWN